MGIFFRVTESPNFDYVVGQLRDMRPVFRGFASYRKSAFAIAIARGKNPYGETYAPLKSAYAAIKAKKYGNRPILVASGAMVESWNCVFTGDTFTESLDSPVAIYHQEGTKKMMQRLLLPTDDRDMSAQDQEKLLNLAIPYIERALR